MIGIGNRMRGEDAVGVLVARSVGAYPGMAVEPRSLLEAFDELDAVVIVDAAIGRPHGMVEEWTVDEALGSVQFGPALSHALGLADALRLAQVLRRLPPYVRIVTVGIELTDLGQSSAVTVLQAIAPAAERAERLLREAG